MGRIFSASEDKDLKMLKLFCLLVIAACAHAASYSNCDNSSPVSISLRRLPDPIVIKAGSKIPISALVTVKSQLPASATLNVKVYVKMPCIKNVGSCSYKFDCTSLKGLCPTCKCPPSPGNIDVNQVVTVPSISIPSFLANGKYKISFELRAGSRLACGTLYVSIKA